MAGTIDAKLRIAAEVTQAIAQLRAVKREILSTGEAAKEAAKQPATPGGADAGAARQASEARRQAARAEKEAARESTRAQREADAEARRLRRQAAAEEAAALATKRKAERDALNAKVREEQEAARKVRAAGNVQAAALNQLPAQVTDIVTGLASGQSPLTVLIQQGGQLRDSFQGAGNAVRALLGLLTPARVLIGGVAAALTAVAGGAIAGALEVDRLNKAFALTGNTAGVSLGQVNGIARRIAGDMKASIGDVRETLAELIEAGSETGGTLEASARAVTAYRKLTGASAAEAVKLFAGQRDSILDWATKANRAYNFLTAEQLNYIRGLQAQGRTEEAVRFTNEELAKTLEQRSVVALGKLEVAWNNVKAAVSRVVDSFKAVGRPETIDEQIANITKRLETARAARDAPLRSGRRRGTFDTEIAQAEAELEALNRLRAADQVRAAERAAAQKAEQDKAYRESRQFQDALLQVDQAGVQKRLAVRLAALDKEQADLEVAREQQVLTEQEVSLRLNEIEQRRIQAQAEAVRRQIELEKKRVIERPEDEFAKQGAVAQLEGQLIALQGRLTATQTQAQGILAASAQQQAAEWQKAWEDASKRIREFVQENAAAAVGRTADPAERARQAADVATSEQRRELAAQQRALRLRIDLTLEPAQVQELQRQLDRLTTEGNRALGERERQARFQSLRQSFDELSDQLRIQEQDIQVLVDSGALSVEDAEQRKLQARAQSVPQLERILALLREISSEGGPAEKNQVAAAANTVTALKNTLTEFQKAAKSSAVNELAQGLFDIQAGAKSAGDALRDMVSGFAKAMLQVLNQRLATKLVDDMISAVQGASSAFKNSGGAGGTGEGSWWGAVANFIVGLFHTGGVIGRSMGSGARAISPLVFAGAQVLHAGGLVGLASDERPVIAKVGEEMLTEDNPRHIKNWRGGAGGVSVQANYTFQGSGGTEQDQRAAADELDRRMRATIEQWAGEQSRQGGIFSGGRRG